MSVPAFMLNSTPAKCEEAPLPEEAKASIDKVNSPWFDMELSSKRSKEEYRYLYSMTQKHSWLSHDEIMSAPFEAMLQQARACNENMQQVVQLVTRS